MAIVNFDPKAEQAAPPNYLAKKSGKSELTLYLYDIIGDTGWGVGIGPQRIVDDINAAGAGLELINVRINSPGGSVFDGLTIYNTLTQHKARVAVWVDGMAVSIASVIAMAGAERNVASNAMWMIHKPGGMVFGDAEDMRKQADVLDLIENNLVNTYAKRTGQKREKLRDMMSDETWFDADESLALGFATRVVEGSDVTNCVIPPQLAARYKHMPRNLAANGKAAHAIRAQRLSALTAKLPALVSAGKANVPARATKEV